MAVNQVLTIELSRKISYGETILSTCTYRQFTTSLENLSEKKRSVADTINGQQVRWKTRRRSSHQKTICSTLGLKQGELNRSIERLRIELQQEVPPVVFLSEFMRQKQKIHAISHSLAKSKIALMELSATKKQQQQLDDYIAKIRETRQKAKEKKRERSQQLLVNRAEATQKVAQIVFRRNAAIVASSSSGYLAKVVLYYLLSRYNRFGARKRKRSRESESTTTWIPWSAAKLWENDAWPWRKASPNWSATSIITWDCMDENLTYSNYSSTHSTAFAGVFFHCRRTGAKGR